MPRPSGWRPCSSARVPMWRGATATYPYAAINFADSICRASASASPPCTTFSSPGLTAPRLQSAFSVRSRARCLRRFWTQWSWRLRRCVHLEKHKVADPMIEADDNSSELLAPFFLHGFKELLQSSHVLIGQVRNEHRRIFEDRFLFVVGCHELSGILAINLH